MATRKDSMERKRKLHAGNLHVAFCKLIARNRMAFAFCGMLAWAGAASAESFEYGRALEERISKWQTEKTI